MQDKLALSLTTLLTGFAIVFAVLLLLIGVIKLYGTIVYNAQNKAKQKSKVMVPVEKPSTPAAVVETVPDDASEVDDDELIAVIAAAVYSIYSPAQVRVKSVKKRLPRSNAWRSAGLADSSRPF